MKNVVLIGMMGTSKTTTGKILAEKLNFPFFDGDRMYEMMYGESISQTFEKVGEQVFREREQAVYQKLGGLNGAVIACGGGVVLNEKNMQSLRANGFIVQLISRPEIIHERVSRNDRRPLVKEGGVEKIEQILSERKDLYDKYCDAKIDNSNLSPKRTADIIVSLYRRQEEQKR